MDRKTILTGTAAAGTLHAASQAEPIIVVKSEVGQAFAEPPAVDALTLQTAHGHMAAIMRQVVKNEDAVAYQLFNEGAVMPEEARVGVEAMRDALKLYDDVTARAAGLPVTAFLNQVVARITSALDVPADADPTDRNALLREALALVKPAILALDYQAQPDVVEAWVTLNAGRNEGVIFVDDPTEDTSSPFYISPERSAKEASTGPNGGVGSSLAQGFYENYEDDVDRPIIKVLIPRPVAAE